MIEKTSTPISSRSTSSNCTEIILLYILTLQRRESSRSTRKLRFQRNAQGPHHPPPGISHFGCSSFWSPCSLRKLWRSGLASSQQESRRIRVNRRKLHSCCRKQIRWSRATTPARHFCRRNILHQVKGNPRNNFWFGMGFLRTTIPVQQDGRPHVQDRKSPKCQQLRGGKSVGLDSKISMDSKLIGKFFTQQVAAAMDKKKTLWK